ncbi:MAG TPA: glycerol-3-phosphate 1-O-acyltransferase PlsB [Dokdonella sp.]|uniref:glycerol-3-phosphate 1-O-acyltransferase PlsB n=1 Tax=Dokdonella sp. TaxID=2291710 RepID=UPI002C503B2B|nr:glycerol-3-phosphate 1-O-acyltransferase PlsB [Dokdonella sp.]HUD42883.1 glycerol-3-phosphate 1-O-acyltransferase PlsB [Dokdonella sp.]
MDPALPGARPAAAGRAPALTRLLCALLRPWLRLRLQPSDPRTLVDASDGRPTVYVLERYGLSDTLILEEAAASAGLPAPLAAADVLPIRRRRSIVYLSRRPRWFGRPQHPTRSETLARLFAHVAQTPGADVRLVPVSIFVGRAPDRQSGWFSVLFSENWVVVGRFRRLLALLLNGRDTIVQFAAPVSLRQLIDEAGGEATERSVRKLSRVLRVHFHRIRAAVIGPDLSHRRTVVNAVLNAEPVREAIAATASKENLPLAKAEKRARDFAMEIAADYSHPLVRSMSFLLNGFWNKLYGGVKMHHFESLRASVPGHEVIYVPCHRSHIDYLLLSWLLYRNGLSVPHIAAGVNLNLPVLGSLLRRGGAFFLRRTFRGNLLYSTVFREYLGQLFARGVPLEYFIEGGRSRTGRLLAPRAGMLSMTLSSFLSQSRRPVLFQPVYIGYEKLMEGKEYIGELSGRPKQKESWLGLLRATKVLRQHYGEVAVSFGEPVYLAELLDEVAPQWREAPGGDDDKPDWAGPAVDALAERILVNINRSADVNPVNLLALALLSTPNHAMAESDLLAQLDLAKRLLVELPYSDRVTVTALEPAQIIAYGEKMQWIERVAHPLGDVLRCGEEQAVLLSYFRNNVQHLFAAAAWVACCFLNNRRMARATLVRLGRLVYPFIRSELFLGWDEDRFGERIEATLDFFTRHDLLETDEDGRIMSRGPGQSDTAFRLRGIAHSLLQAFERYYIALAALVKNGPHSLTAGELENLCYLTAQRLSLLHEVNAPEFFDKSLFRGFIQKLRERRVVWLDENGKLDFDGSLEEVARDARVILSREIRHGILKLTQDMRARLAEDAPEGAAAAAAKPGA